MIQPDGDSEEVTFTTDEEALNSSSDDDYGNLSQPRRKINRLSKRGQLTQNKKTLIYIHF